MILPGLVALAFRFQENARDALVWTFIGTSVVFAMGGITERWALGRVFPAMMLSSHVAFAAAVANYLASPERPALRKRLVLAATAGMLVLGLVGSLAAAARMVPRDLLPDRLADDARLASLIEPYRPLSTVIRPTDRVVASPSLSQEVAGISGYVLVPPFPTFLDDESDAFKMPPRS